MNFFQELEKQKRQAEILDFEKFQKAFKNLPKPKLEPYEKPFGQKEKTETL